MQTFLRLLFLAVASLAPLVAAPIPIPTTPATTAYGPLTIQHPADWTKRDASIGAGVVLQSPNPIILGGKKLKLVIIAGKDAVAIKSIAELKSVMTSEMTQQAKKLDEAIQKVIEKETARKNMTLHLTGMGNCSLDTESRNGVDVLRSTFTGVQAIDGQPASFRTEGFYHLANGGLYSVTFSYPTEMAADYEPFVAWLMSQVQVAQP